MKQKRLRYKLLALFLFLLFAVLAVYGTRSVLTYGNRWFSSIRNPRVRTQKELVIAGDILDCEGAVLAHTDSEGVRQYHPDAAVRSALVHVVGDGQGQIANGVETFQTSYLYGFQVSLPELILGLFSGEPRTGDTVQLTVSAPLSAAVAAAFEAQPQTAGKRGAAVVMNWRTGAVAALVSLPSFDPCAITDAVRADAGKPFWNRATQAKYPPGSTFKTVTAAAALKNIPRAEEIRIECTTDVLDFGSHVISDYGGGAHGTVGLRSGYLQSCNKLFANVALNVGAERLRTEAERFGFNDNFLFRDLVVENSVYPAGSLSDYELAACGFGQSAIAATPLHMCMIAAGVANGGQMMEPRLIQSVSAAAGGSRLAFSSAPYRTCMDAETAAKLQGYMRGVVSEGTGRRAAVSGLTVCGKTGTSDSTEGGTAVSYGWFIGYIAEEDCPYAIAVVVENLDPGVSGGTSAAPVAGQVFRWLRDHPLGSPAAAP